MKNNAICPLCNQGYRMGYNGIVEGCDKCLGNVRDANGYVYGPDEKFITLKSVCTGKVTKRKRPGIIKRFIGRLFS
jgi:hypothetical protein